MSHDGPTREATPEAEPGEVCVAENVVMIRNGGAAGDALGAVHAGLVGAQRGVLATTHPCSNMVVVNGPIARELDINGGYNALGQGWRSNASIGRAVRLVMLNVGGALPGDLDRATQA